MLGDIRYALRMLLKSPAFSAISILTLALGIGANSAIFTLIDGLFLRGLPFAEPNRIVRIYGEAKERDMQQMPFSVPRYWHYRDGQTVFSGLAADSGMGFILTGMGDPVQLNGGIVTANYFDLLGVRPLRGRLFLPNEEEKADVAVISEHFWRKQLASDPQVLGRSLTLNGVPTTIVGVIPTMPLAWFGLDCEVWTTKPFELPGMTREMLMRGVGYLRVIGRLKPGVTNEQATAALAVVQKGYAAQHPGIFDGSWSPALVSAAEDVTGNLRPAFLTLLAAVAAVLLIACSNVANLLLVRFTARRREIALRAALGASRGGLVRLFIFESTLLSLVAGAPRSAPRLLDDCGGSEIGREQHPAGTESHSALAGFSLHSCPFVRHRIRHGFVSGLAKLAHRTGERIERWRPLHERKPRPAAGPSRAGRGPGRVVGPAARGRGAFARELHPVEPRKNWFPSGGNLARRDRPARRALRRRAIAGAIRRAAARRAARRCRASNRRRSRTRFRSVAVFRILHTRGRIPRLRHWRNVRSRSRTASRPVISAPLAFRSLPVAISNRRTMPIIRRWS